MNLVCLDLEGVLVPEIWIAFADASGIPELRRTTRDEPDYGKLMSFRLALLKERGLRLADIQRVIASLDPLPGAIEFADAIRARTQLIILSDTFSQFARPLMEKLSRPTLFCNTLTVDSSGLITGYTLRQKDGKRQAVRALKGLNIRVFAAGDSFNDLGMIAEADSGCLFRAPPSIRASHPDTPCVDTYSDFLSKIDSFLGN